MTKITKIQGREIDLDRIENPKLKRVALERCHEFMFAHSEQSYSDSDHRDSGGHRDYYRDSHQNYSENEGHTDHVNDGSWYKSLAQKGHLDYTDEGHSDHHEYFDRHSDYT